MKNRLLALDGLRGLSIIFVIFTHLPLGVWYSVVPYQLHFLLNILLGNGPTGVFVFFILTGFLMGMLYPAPNSYLGFLSRRYLRLFPPFLSMVVSFMILSLMDNRSPIISICMVLICAIVTHKIWIYGAMHSGKFRISAWILPLWLGIQLAAALAYIYIVTKVPPPVFLQLWNVKLRIVIGAIINGTLTLPFGQYIAQMDGVYWTLVAEVLFYLLYPIIVIPLLARAQKISSLVLKTIVYLSLFPFFFGLFLMGERILGFEIIKIHYMIYFVTGVILGIHRAYFQSLLSPYKIVTSSFWWLVFLCISTFGLIIIKGFVPQLYHPIFSFVWIVPLSLFILTLLDHESVSSKIFSNKLLVFFGTYSYALYLVHSFVIGWAQNFISQNTPFIRLALTILVFIISIALSWILHYLLERPYFIYRSAKKAETRTVISTQKYTGSKTMIAAFLLLIILLYFAYKPPLSLFTFSKRYGVRTYLPTHRYISLSSAVTEKKFVARHNNLGMIQFHIRNRPTDIKGYEEAQLLVRLKNEENQILGTSSYELSQIIDSRYHPFGFPLQEVSKDRIYTIEYQLTDDVLAQDIQLNSSEGDFITVYFIDKKELLKQPRVALIWILSKITEPAANPSFWWNMIWITPFILLVWILPLFADTEVRGENTKTRMQ